jgi:putative Mn2+ efflux pump MntP
MKISTDDQKAISLILICLGFLSFLIGLAGHLKAGFQSRAEIATTGFIAAAILAGLGILMLLISFTRKQG